MDNICVNCNGAIQDILGGSWIHTETDRRFCWVDGINDGTKQAAPAVANIDWASI